MSDLEKAARDAVDAAHNSEQLALIQAVLVAQQLTQQQACQHPPAPAQSPNTGKWIALGVCAPFLAVSLAISVMAAGITAVCLTACLLVLRSMWRDFERGKTKGR